MSSSVYDIEPLLPTATMEASSTTTTKPELPLGWTQLSRDKKPRSSSNNKEAGNDLFDDNCCDDPTCARPAHGAPRFNPSGAAILQGQAIFCLAEIDAKWFQGYFSMRGRKPLGLLAEQTDIDECLQCNDGGYRELSIQLFRRDHQPKVTFANVEWTGGDMIKLQAAGMVFETEKFLTGKKAVPLVEQYFGGLVKKLREHEGEDTPLLDLIPDVAIVMGNMSLSLPKESADGGF
jgi:hypothetical protein